LEKRFGEYHENDQYALIKAVFAEYWWKLVLTFLLMWASIGLGSVDTFLVKEIMGYIEGESDDMKLALIFVGVHAGFNVLMSMFSIYCNNHMVILGHAAKYSIIGMIYRRILRISPKTNKKFSKGDIISYINGDSWKINWIFGSLADFSSIPIRIAIYFVSIYILIGWNILFALFMIGLFTGISYLLNDFGTKVYKEILEANAK
jgi:ABC-type bacteriocin/lantibiotic exporter with double-glycine peptidase domain